MVTVTRSKRSGRLCRGGDGDGEGEGDGDGEDEDDDDDDADDDDDDDDDEEEEEEENEEPGGCGGDVGSMGEDNGEGNANGWDRTCAPQ